jgi:hypothetical protein
MKLAMIRAFWKSGRLEKLKAPIAISCPADKDELPGDEQDEKPQLFAVRMQAAAIEGRKPVETELSVPATRIICAVELPAAPNWTTLKPDANSEY